MAKDVIITPTSGSLVFSGSTSPLSSSFISDDSGSLTLFLEKEGNQSFTIEGSGSTILEINGASGQLFSIQDSLSGSLFSVTNASGFPVFEVFSDNTIKIGTYDEEAIVVNGTTAVVKGTLSGSGGSQATANKYEFGYEVTSAFPVTGSGLIVSSSNLPSNHYNMVKIGETELLDINSAITPNTFLVHNVDTIIVASGSEPVDIYDNSPGGGKLFEHNGEDFKVYSGGTIKLTTSNASTTFTNTVIANGLRSTAQLDSSPGNLAVWDDTPSSLTDLKYTPASTFLLSSQSEQSLEGNLSITGSISASTYYGDGSNLTGLDTVEVGKATAVATGAYGYGSRVFTDWDSGLSLTRGAVYYWSGSTWDGASATTESTANGLLTICAQDGGNEMVAEGTVYVSTTLTGFTNGKPVYLSTTTGGITNSPPTGSGEIVRVVGYVVNSTKNTIYFDPSKDFFEVE